MSKFSIISERDQLIMTAINRYCWAQWSGKKDALKRACYYKTVGHRRRIFWTCELCGRTGLTREEVAVDHIEPRIPVTGFDDILSWIERTLCDAADLQVICVEPCHHEKTAKEAAQRAEARKAKKGKAKRKQGRKG